MAWLEPPLATRLDEPPRLTTPLSCGVLGRFGEFSGEWRLARCRLSSDRRVSAVLEGCGVPHYAAMTRHVLIGKDGRKRAFVGPMHGGYLFVAGEIETRSTWSSDLVRIDLIADQQQVIADLERLEKVRMAGLPITHEREYTPGDEIDVTSGVYEGIRGRLIRRENRHELAVEIKTLGRSMLVVLPDSDVRLARPAAPIKYRSRDARRAAI